MRTTGPLDDTACPFCGKDMKRLHRRYVHLQLGRLVSCEHCKAKSVVFSVNNDPIFPTITLTTDGGYLAGYRAKAGEKETWEANLPTA